MHVCEVSRLQGRAQRAFEVDIRGYGSSHLQWNGYTEQSTWLQAMMPSVTCMSMAAHSGPPSLSHLHHRCNDGLGSLWREIEAAWKLRTRAFELLLETV